MSYVPHSEPDDPAFSRWHLEAPRGKVLRRDPSRNIGGGPAFDIPLGKNAYSAGVCAYPDSARVHACSGVVPAAQPATSGSM